MHLKRATHRTITFCLCCIVFVLAFSCKVATTEESRNFGETNEFPDMILHEADYVVGIAGNNPIRIHANTIEMFEADQRAILDTVTFVQEDEQGNANITGSSNRMEINIENNNATLTGSVLIENHKEDIRIQADSLSWYHDTHLLESGPEDTVILYYKDRYTMKGKGFSGNFDEAIFEFISIEEGALSDGSQ